METIKVQAITENGTVVEQINFPPVSIQKGTIGVPFQPGSVPFRPGVWNCGKAGIVSSGTFFGVEIRRDELEETYKVDGIIRFNNGYKTKTIKISPVQYQSIHHLHSNSLKVELSLLQSGTFVPFSTKSLN